MNICKRCHNSFVPEYIDMTDLCSVCTNEIISEHEALSPNEESESLALLEGVMSDMDRNSEMESLLSAPGVSLTIAKLIVVSKVRDELSLLAQNCFRLGAWMALKRVKLEKLIK